MRNYLLITCILFVSLTSCSNKEHQKEEKKYYTIKVKGIEVKCEVAFKKADRHKGLKYRDKLPENTGMLFIFKEKGRYDFTMRECIIDLSIAFIDENGTIVDIVEMKRLESEPYKSKYDFLYALEMEEEWFKKHNIDIADKVEFPEEIKSLEAE